MLILLGIFTVLMVICAIAIFIYIDECMQLRKRLLKLGLRRDELPSFPKGMAIGELSEMLYEKETELAEECFLTVEKNV